MSAQPVESHDPHDPERILARLPERVRPQFLGEYRDAVDNAHEVAGYRQLREMLHSWSVRAAAYSKPDFFERAEDAKAGRGEYVSLDDVVARRQLR